MQPILTKPNSLFKVSLFRFPLSSPVTVLPGSSVINEIEEKFKGEMRL
jgi:hypothetical protein